MSVDLTHRNPIVCDGPLSRARGAVGRQLGENDLLILDFSEVATQDIWMLGVSQPLDVAFLRDGEVVECTMLSPMTGSASHTADVVLEAPVGTLNLESGDKVELPEPEGRPRVRNYAVQAIVLGGMAAVIVGNGLRVSGEKTTGLALMALAVGLVGGACYLIFVSDLEVAR